MGTLTLNNCTVRANRATGNGGGIANGAFTPFGDDPGTLTVINSSFSGNSAAADGGGISNLVGTATLTNCTVMGNSAGSFLLSGGGIYNYNYAI